MAVPTLHLNLAPRPNPWRQHHRLLGWAALGFGAAFLAGSLALTWRAYHQASRAGRDAVSLTEEARRAARQESEIQASLQSMDAAREQSRWKVAERILLERSLPWSRVTAELEQCMVPGMRLKGLQRTRGNGQQVVMKLKAEAQTREAEAAFVESLRSTPVFAQVVLEREAERQGGGWDFELNLPAAAVPPPFQWKAVKAGPATAGPGAPAPRSLPSASRPLSTSQPTQSAVPPPTATPVAPLVQATKEEVQAQPSSTEDEEDRTPRRSRFSRRPPR